MFSLMLFMFLFFLGSIAMFFYMLKKIDDNTRQLNEEHAQIRVLFRAIESRLDKILKMESQETLPQNEQTEDENTDYDPLLSLNFDQKTEPEKDFFKNTGLDMNFDPDSTIANPGFPPLWEPGNDKKE